MFCSAHCTNMAPQSALHIAALQTRGRHRTLGLMLVIAYLVLPGVSTVIFKTFSCERFDNGDLLLRADYSLDCSSDDHRWYTVYAGLALVAYPVG